MLLFGMDIGNGAVKLVGPISDQRTLIPHALARCPDGFRRDTALLSPGDDPLDHLHVLVHWNGTTAEEVLAGNVVLREYPHLAQESRAGEDKSGSGRHVALALTVLAAAIMRANPVSSGAAVGVATALPAAEYSRPGARENLVRAIQGRHAVTFLSGPASGWAGRTVDVDIQHVDVLPEGAPAFLTLAERDPALTRGAVMILDVGVRSVEWAVFQDARYQPALSGGRMDGGLSTAADRILEEARMMHGARFGRHRGDVLNALWTASRNGGRVVLSGMGRRVDLTDVAHDALTETAGFVAGLLAAALRRQPDLSAVYIVGGAGAVLFPQLTAVAPVPVRLAPDPLWANALGLWKRAKALAGSGRWS